MARIQITESIESIKAKILFELKAQVNERMRKAAPIIRAKVGSLIADKIAATPHIQSILSGKLQSDFGLTGPAAQLAVNELISAIRQTTGVNLDIKNGFAYSMSVTLLPQGLSQAVGNIGQYQSNGHVISWMRWLLFEGVTVVVDDHFVADDTTGSIKSFGKSRSGRALMFHSEGRSFRVDPTFAGTEDDNFVVNTIRGLFDEVYFIVLGYL